MATQAPQAQPVPRLSLIAALAVGVTAISFAALFFRLTAPTHPLVSSGLRLLIAAFVLSPFSIRAWRRDALSRDILKAGVYCGVAYAVHFGAWVWSLELTTVAASVTLVTATPAMLAAASLISGKDRPVARTWFALTLSVFGVSIIGGVDLGESWQNLLGDLLALVGAAAMAGYLLMVRQLGHFDVWSFAGIVTAVGGTLLLGLAAFLGIPPVPASAEALGYIMMAALIPQLLGHSALTWALRHASPTQVGLSTLGEPVGATLLAWAFLQEAPGHLTLVGCAVTLIAVAMAMTASRRNQPSA